jgi:glycosyltransferase involved in cell wall biosynthesis
MKIGIVLRDNFGACEWYRLILPFEYLKSELIKFDIEIEYIYESNFLENSTIYDIIYLAKHSIRKFFKQAQQHGKFIIFDVDDYFLNRPDFVIWLRYANKITTTNERLKTKMLEHNVEIDIDVFENSIPHLDARFMIPKNKNIFNIGYLGHNSHLKDFSLVQNLNFKLNNTLNNHKFTLYGYEITERHQASEGYINLLTNNKLCLDNFDVVNFIPINNFFSLYSNVTVSIAPLINIPFNQCKSNLKFLEAALSDTFFVGSDIITYSDIVIDGYNGFLAKDCNEFVDKIVDISRNKERYQYILDNARNDVIKKLNFYSIQNRRLEYILNILGIKL